MLKIRLRRQGAKGRPSYKIVVMESTTKRDGKYVDQVGFYDPMTKPSTVKFEKEAVLEWIKKGAQPTEKVKYLLIKSGIIKENK